jgi:hypothetical protein
MDHDPFDLGALRLPDELQAIRCEPVKLKKRRVHFIQVPWTWVEKLSRTRSANTYKVALHLLYLHWKAKGDPIKLANGTLAIDGVTRFSKSRALGELERLGLIEVRRRSRKSPTVTMVR